MPISASPAAQRRRAALLSLVLAGGLLAGTVAAADDASASPAAAATTAGATTGGSAAAAPAAGQPGGGFVLHVGVSVYSPNRAYRLVVADYGDLLLLGPGNVVVWHSQTAGESDASLALLDDGDLVLRSQGGRTMWHSGTNGYGASTMSVTDDGRVVLTAARGVSWTSAGLVARPHGGVTQVDPIAARVGTWALGQAFSGRGDCNPYSPLLGYHSVGCPSRQARHAWNIDFARVAWERNGAAAPDVDNVIYFQNVATMHPAASRYTPEPGDVAVFWAGHDNTTGRVGVVTEVNTATRMVRLAFGDVDDALLHVWMPVTGSTFRGEPLHAYAHPRAA